MITSFDKILHSYLSLEKKVDSNSDTYITLIRTLPNRITKILGRADIIVKGSMGQGNRTLYPWISILNKQITHTTQDGLYVVYLFRSDMSGFYLALSQGITNFDKLYHNKKYQYAERAARYFQGELAEETYFSIEPIDLVSTKSSLGYGYEKTTILSKYYAAGQYSDTELVDDLREMIRIYDLVYSHMNDKPYNEVLAAILSNENNYLVDGDEAITAIDELLNSETTYPRDNQKVLIEVHASSEKSRKFRRISSPHNSKIDFAAKASRDSIIGLQGERLVLEYEKNRLISLGLEQYADQVMWTSIQTDAAGYDIKSFHVASNGKIVELFIEVKTSSLRTDTDFFVSKNEVHVSNEKLHNYAIYRIFDVLSIHPRFYIAYGKIDENFLLDPVTFSATYKWNVL